MPPPGTPHHLSYIKCPTSSPHSHHSHTLDVHISSSPIPSLFRQPSSSKDTPHNPQPLYHVCPAAQSLPLLYLSLPGSSCLDVLVGLITWLCSLAHRPAWGEWQSLPDADWFQASPLVVVTPVGDKSPGAPTLRNASSLESLRKCRPLSPLFPLAIATQPGKGR